MTTRHVHHLQSRVRAYTLKHGMLDRGDKVLVMYSGGPDSTVLLHVLLALREELELELIALHCNHGLRLQADAEQEAVERWCDAWGLRVISVPLDVFMFARERKMGLEEAGRYGRQRAAMEATREEGADKVAFGHTADDAAEWSLMNLVRGTSLSGLTGMAPAEGHKIRPLLGVSKSDVLTYLQALGLPYVVDASNSEGRFLRSRIRTELTPVITALNPNFLRSLERTTELLRLDAEFLSQSYDDIRDELRISGDSLEVLLDREALSRAHPALQARAIFDAASDVSSPGTRVTAAPILQALRLIEKGNCGARVMLARGVRICLEVDAVVISTAFGLEVDECALDIPGTAEIPGIGTVKARLTSVAPSALSSPGAVVLDADTVMPPLKVRGWRHGDWFIPLGMTGRKKLQDFFVDAKVPRRLRSMVPVVEDAEKLLWVVGHRIDARARVAESTNRFMILGYAGAENEKG